MSTELLPMWGVDLKEQLQSELDRGCSFRKEPRNPLTCSVKLCVIILEPTLD
jgi:hypothetical protein